MIVLPRVPNPGSGGFCLEARGYEVALTEMLRRNHHPTEGSGDSSFEADSGAGSHQRGLESKLGLLQKEGMNRT